MRSQEIKRAENAPMRIEQVKIVQNSPTEASISCWIFLLSLPILITVSYMTMPIASLKIDSPKIIAYILTSASIYLKIASTETGSVALIRLPKANDSLQENSGERLV